MDLEMLSTNENNNFDDCSPECLPFEDSLNKDLRNVKGKSIEELEKQWKTENEESKERAEEYLKHTEMLNDFDDDDNDNDGYSSEEDIPTCNPWRE